MSQKHLQAAKFSLGLWNMFPFSRLLSTTGVLLVLASCSTPSLPEVSVASIRKVAPLNEVVRHEPLATTLLEAAAAMENSGPRSESYNKAVESFIMELQRKISPHEWHKPLRISGHGEEWEISFDDRPFQAQGNPEWSPGFFDSFTPSHAIDVKRYNSQVAGSGVGVPFVLTSKDTRELQKERAFRPGNGIYVPGTAVLEFGKPNPGTRLRPVRLRIFNTYKVRTAVVSGDTQRLAYDITSAVEANLDNSYIRENGLLGLFRVDRRESDLGLFGLDVYDPKKIPVVFVHGLNSSPRIWAQAVNTIYANPELNNRYQPVLFIYPTGMAVPAAAARFRQSLELYQSTWDPDHDDVAFREMIIVGHSMGGLLTRLQVIETGDRMRKAFFTCPISEVSFMTAEEKRLAQFALVLEPLPFVKRVVFIATPHRGSKIADRGVVQIVVRLIKLPADITFRLARAVTEGRDVLNPELFRYHNLGLSSVAMLSPEHPYFKALNQCPIKVPFHSIIGDRGKGPGPDCSDGVVPYSSAHLENAASEKIIPCPHGCTMRREAVEEIVRILKLHAR